MAQPVSAGHIGLVVDDQKEATRRAREAGAEPVPGGVGPMTIAMLMKNTLLAATRQLGAA